MNLYQIDREIEEVLMNLVDDETGEVDEEKLEQLNQLNVDRKEKIENCVLFAKSLRADGDAIMNESNALKERASRKFNKAERILQYVDMSLNGEKFETERCLVTYRPSQAVEILNEDALEDRFFRVKTDRKPDKTSIKKALKAGEVVTGAVLVDKLNMQVK